MSKRRLSMVDAKAQLRARDERMPDPDLESYDFIVISSSAGKDSQAQLTHVTGLCAALGIEDRIVVVHCDLGRVEWQGTLELAREQADVYGHRFEVVTRIGLVSKGLTRGGAPLYPKGARYGDLLDQVLRRHIQLMRNGKNAPAWPSADARWCTSDFKRGPVGTLFTALAKEWRELTGLKRPCRILDCIGLRADESKGRAKADQLSKRTHTVRQHVDTWLPIKWWSVDEVWDTIRESGVPSHPAYSYGMPRLSCAFCVFASRDALMIAGQHNPELLAEYVAVEREIGWSFKQGLALADIQAALAKGERAKTATDWSA